MDSNPYFHQVQEVESWDELYIKAKQPESGDLCGNITEFGVVEEHLSSPNEVILPYSTPDEGCFVFIFYCLMVLSHSKLR